MEKSGSFLILLALAGAICHCILRLIFRQKASFIKLRCDICALLHIRE